MVLDLHSLRVVCVCLPRLVLFSIVSSIVCVFPSSLFGHEGFELPAALEAWETISGLVLKENGLVCLPWPWSQQPRGILAKIRCHGRDERVAPRHGGDVGRRLLVGRRMEKAFAVHLWAYFPLLGVF